MSEIKTNQTYVYTGSSEYSFDNIILDNVSGLSLNATRSGNGGINEIPYDGATVTMKTGVIGADSTVKDLQPSMNNKLYYLITDKVYDRSERDTVVSLATEVSVAVVSGKYQGEFVFSNPNNYLNLYLIWDYTDNMGSGAASYSGGLVTKNIDVDFGAGIGLTGINYDITDVPARLVLKQGTRTLADTGYVGLNSTANYNALIAAGVLADDIKLSTPYNGSVNNGIGNAFIKKTNTSLEGKITMHSPLASTSWALNTITPSLKSFFIDTDGKGTSALACGECPTTTYYHNGVNTLPEPGDTIYNDSSGISTSATATIIGNASLNGASGTSMILRNADGSTVTFTTNPTLNFGDVSASVGDHAWRVNTKDISGGSEVRKATQALHIAALAAIAAGELDMTAIPTTNTGTQTSFTLTQTTHGTAGNTAITLITGATANGETSFTGGGESAIFNGDDKYYLSDSTTCAGAPVVFAKWLLINSNGLVVSKGSCNCTEFAAPFISQGDVEILASPSSTGIINSDVNPNNIDRIYIQSSGNPTSWEFVSTCNFYEIFGSTEGVMFTYTNCKGQVVKDISGIDQTKSVIASSTPTITSGTGTVTLAEPFAELPEGLNFNSNSGILSGRVYGTGSYPITLKATNCFGTSAAKTININVKERYNVTAFAIGSDNPMDTGDAACAMAPALTIMYHNGSERLPRLNDRIYTDALGSISLIGNSQWYYLNKSTYSLNIDSTGRVIERNECPASVTTTTTTTTTTSTTTLPATGSFFTATLCSDGATVGTLYYDIGSGIPSVGNIVKTTDGNCWTITATRSAAFPYQTISRVGSTTYASCTVCLGATTTTTTTSTTTATPISAFTMDADGFSTALRACLNGGAPYATYYHNGSGSYPTTNDLVFTNSGGTTPFDGSSLWRKDSNSTAEVLHISSTGQVLDSRVCSGVTTTTTTATPATFYDTTPCAGGSTVVLNFVGSIAIGSVVKAANGTCYTVAGVSSSTSATSLIEFVYSTCLDCTGLTTTTSTTTTTTTTTSTTTTTTTLAPLSEVILRFGADSTAACTGVVGTYYIDGAVGVVGKKVWTNNNSTGAATAGYYVQLGSSIAYQWTGTTWRSTQHPCE